MPECSIAWVKEFCRHRVVSAKIDGSELLPANGADEDHKVLRPVQDQIKGFRDAKLWLDAVDDASTLGEGDEDGQLEHNIR
ncbi:hypothetical protein B296_00006089 [Ensete ventricosum]|uniref:Uncharacterized protein n=1 Tax=Ensete ventricosum TaxID=4639 RepID=A0A426YWF7_ENSVE|nr:hypothetical protein B296_00006089 [Ensete ventricosum]